MKKILFLLLSVFFVGCSSSVDIDESTGVIETKKDDSKKETMTKEEPTQQTEKKPEKVVEETFEAMKSTDMDKLSKLLTGETSAEVIEGDAFLELVKASNKMLKYKITNTIIEGDNAIVTVDCTYGDVRTIFGTAFMEYFQTAMGIAFSGEEATQEEVDKMLADAIINALENSTPEEYTTTVEVPCVKIDKKWAIDTSIENLALEDVMTGNLVSALQEMSDSMNSVE